MQYIFKLRNKTQIIVIFFKDKGKDVIVHHSISNDMYVYIYIYIFMCT